MLDFHSDMTTQFQWRTDGGMHTEQSKLFEDCNLYNFT